ncbi:MAG: MEKHLA domain-containing protein [Porphyrobacter sp.]|nr:MEKHLA domain-containing protein [Porphyrobacter sp.]
MSVEEDERTAMRDSAGSRLALIAESYARITGEPLVEGSPEDLEEALWHSPHVILVHGDEPVPRIFYANRQALDLYEMTAEAFIGMPSHLCAEPTRRHERVKVLTELEKRNLVEVDTGVRIASSGRRFRLVRAKSWNLLDEHGAKHGVVAYYLEWRHLDPA